MAKLSRDKGKRGELEVAKLFRDAGFEAHRGQQFAGGGDSPDVIHSVDGLHVEVKRVEAFHLWPALQQAKDDMKKGDVPVVFHRKNGKEWVAILPATDFLEMLGEIYE